MNINDIRKLAIEKKERLMLNDESVDMIDSVLAFLSDDMCFFKVDINLSIPILLYLGIREDNVKEVYFQLLDSKNFKKECEVRTIIER